MYSQRPIAVTLWDDRTKTSQYVTLAVNASHIVIRDANDQPLFARTSDDDTNRLCDN